MKKVRKLVSALLSFALAFTVTPFSAAAAGESLTSDVTDLSVIVAGEPFEFEVTAAGGDDTTMVEGYFDYDESAVEKLEYYETHPAYKGWRELTGDTFGPVDGFPFQAAATTSKFRVTFSEGGKFDTIVGLRDLATGTSIVENTITFNVEEAPTVTVNAPDEFIVGQQTPYSVTTTGTTSYDNVLAYFENSNGSIIEKVEYLETAVDPHEWRELTGNSFGPAGTGFPFTDGATSEFRVTFKEPGENDVKISLKAVKDGTVVAETTAKMEAVSAIDRIDVVDGADGFTPVKEPKAGQVLLANIVMKDGNTIGTYPPNSNVTYKWYYEDAGNVLGTEAAYTVTNDNLGKVICLDVTVTDQNGYEHKATWKSGAVPVKGSVTGVKVVDGNDGYTEVTEPKAGQVLYANIQIKVGNVTSEIGVSPVNEDANYKWYYRESPDTILGTAPIYTVTSDNLGKTLCVDVTVEGYTGSATWKSGEQIAVQGKVTGVSVVDGTDGYTPVTAPVVGQKLTANILTDQGEIGSYPVNEEANYKWYYQDAPDVVLGTEPVYTVTSDNLGRVLCVDVSVDIYSGSATRTAAAAVAEAPVEPEEPDDNDNDRPPYVPGGSGSGNRDDDEDTDDTSDVTPDNPGDVTPGTPGDATPGTPGDATPGTPGDATPGTPDASGEDDVAQPPQTGVKVAGSLAVLAGAAAVAAITFKKRGK